MISAPELSSIASLIGIERDENLNAVYEIPTVKERRLSGNP